VLVILRMGLMGARVRRRVLGRVLPVLPVLPVLLVVLPVVLVPLILLLLLEKREGGETAAVVKR